jgi:glycosyltransferase involved in cell wall biosynthesis
MVSDAGSERTNEPVSVSVVIPCRNEERFIGGCLTSLLANTYPQRSVEILVVDGLSTDRTCEIVREVSSSYPRVRLLANPSGRTAAGFNIGVRASTAPIVLRFDAHSQCAPDYLETLVGGLDAYRADNVGGVFVTRPRRDTGLGRAIALSLSHPLGVGNSAFRIGAEQPREVDTVPFGCWRREVFDRIGLLDEGLIRNQDLEFNQRLRKAGGRIVLIPQARVIYYARSGFLEHWRNAAENGFWITYSWLTRGSGYSVRHFVPGIFVLGLLGAVVLALGGRPWPIAGVALVYLTAVGAASLQIGRRTGDWKAAALLPAALLALHVSYGLGSLKGIAAGLFDRLKALGRSQFSRQSLG